VGRYVLNRLAQAVPVLLGASVVVFLLVRLVPGDIVDVMLGTEGTMTAEARAHLRRSFGLDAPIHLQYLYWLGAVLRGDLGISLRTGQPVAVALTQGLGVTLELAVLSLVLAAVLAIPLGVATAIVRNSRWDAGGRMLGLVGLSFPNFWLATLLILLASRFLGWAPAIEFVGPVENLAANLRQMLLPTLSLALGLMAIIMRMTRSAMLEILGQDFVRVARAKGLAERVVLGRHALKNALIPVVTVMGIQMGYLLGGVVVIEQIFGLPGVGWMLLNALFQRDYPVVQPAILLLTALFVLVNLAVDLLYAVIDPRIRYS
jgi:peptide/nickel transport system permease protein